MTRGFAQYLAAVQDRSHSACLRESLATVLAELAALQLWNCRSSHIWNWTYYLIWSSDVSLSEKKGYSYRSIDSLHENTSETQEDGHLPGSLEMGRFPKSISHWRLLQCTKLFQTITLWLKLIYVVNPLYYLDSMGASRLVNDRRHLTVSFLELPPLLTF